MIELQLQDTEDELLAELEVSYGQDWPAIEADVARHVHRAGLLPHQGCALAILADQFDKGSAKFLEVGTSHGYSAAVMRSAAPKAHITTLEPDRETRRAARANLDGMGIDVRPQMSAVYLDEVLAAKRKYDLVFIDGDHKHAMADMPYFNTLKRGGLFLWHDYSPEGSGHPCPPVFEALNWFAQDLGREPDVLVRTDDGTGMAGWYRRQGESV